MAASPPWPERVDCDELRSAFAVAEEIDNPLVRLRAQYVHWVVDHPAASATAAGWRRWLASDEQN
jgi:hypothetical protein